LKKIKKMKNNLKNAYKNAKISKIQEKIKLYNASDFSEDNLEIYKYGAGNEICI